MKIYKFGGASIKDAEGIKNVVEILKNQAQEGLVIVVSAIGKTTNHLEELVNDYVSHKRTSLEEIKKIHFNILNQLFESNHSIYNEVNNLFVEVEWAIEDIPTSNYAYEYDQIVSVGELLSTKIVSAYLNKEGYVNTWLDARDLIKTDNTYRNARVDWKISAIEIKKRIKKSKVYLTQGFIGCTSENFSTTLGREGSDFSAAILAHALDACEVVIWKDVPGVLNADPRFFDDAQLLETITYSEAIELAYFGAKVIHPKTIQPLKNKNIPLRVRSFLDEKLKGTLIREGVDINPFLPSFIVKKNQILISVSAKDLSFIVEDHLSHIFLLFAKANVSINVMQNSAVSFTVCVDDDKNKITSLIEALKERYRVCYNDGLILYTIRHYNATAIEKVKAQRKVLLEQKSRSTIRLVFEYKNNN